jgi:hypothetical protein
MGASRTTAGFSPQLAKPVQLLVLFLSTTADLAWGADPCPVQTSCELYTDFRLQLRRLKSAQFAGFYAALELGFWRDECLNVMINPSASTCEPERTSDVDLVENADAFIPDYL